MAPKPATRSFEIKWRYKPGTGQDDRVRVFYEIGITREGAIASFLVTHLKTKVDILSVKLYKEYK